MANQRVVVRTLELPPIRTARSSTPPSASRRPSRCPCRSTGRPRHHLLDTVETGRARACGCARRRAPGHGRPPARRRPRGGPASRRRGPRRLRDGAGAARPEDTELASGPTGETEDAEASCTCPSAAWSTWPSPARAAACSPASAAAASRPGHRAGRAPAPDAIDRRAWLGTSAWRPTLEALDGDEMVGGRSSTTACAAIAGEVRNSLDFHAAPRAPPAAVARVLLTGPATAVPGFATALGGALALPVSRSPRRRRPASTTVASPWRPAWPSSRSHA